MNQLLTIRDREVRITGLLVRTARLEGDGFEFLENPQTFLNELRHADRRIDLFTFMQRLPDTTPKYDYPLQWDNFAALPITTFEDWWSKQIGFKARNKAKQAEKKGVLIREVRFDESLVAGIREIYNETPVRQGRRFPHFGKSYEQVYAAEATFLDRAIFIAAYFDSKLIGFVKLVYDETLTQAGTMNILSMISHRDKAPTNALVAQAVRSCAERGIRYLVYSQYAYGRKERSGITEFKERNGFQRIDVPRYVVPFTAIGWGALKLGLNKTLGDYFPEVVGVRLRELRAAWYKHKYGASAETA